MGSASSYCMAAIESPANGSHLGDVAAAARVRPRAQRVHTGLRVYWFAHVVQTRAMARGDQASAYSMAQLLLCRIAANAPLLCNQAGSLIAGQRPRRMCRGCSVWLCPPGTGPRTQAPGHVGLGQRAAAKYGCEELAKALPAAKTAQRELGLMQKFPSGRASLMLM